MYASECMKNTFSKLLIKFFQKQSPGGILSNKKDVLNNLLKILNKWMYASECMKNTFSKLLIKFFQKQSPGGIL